ncbi:MAG: hypothetical protein ACRC1M_01675 [Methanobacteriaceae archaeon]
MSVSNSYFFNYILMEFNGRVFFVLLQVVFVAAALHPGGLSQNNFEDFIF